MSGSAARIETFRETAESCRTGYDGEMDRDPIGARYYSSRALILELSKTLKGLQRDKVAFWITEEDEHGHEPFGEVTELIDLLIKQLAAGLAA